MLKYSTFFCILTLLITLNGDVLEQQEDDIDDVVTIRDGSKMFNFASHTAGAVVIDKSPPSGKGFSNLLNDDKDKYAISPCNEKKWVVIGLSEDISITSVAIANYERYSSMLKEFHLYAANSYPTDDWIDLGSYIAEARLGEQLFNVTNPSHSFLHTRYLKVKFKSHYDNDALCTLSQIKVHGMTVIASFQQEVEWSDTERRDMLQQLSSEIVLEPPAETTLVISDFHSNTADESQRTQTLIDSKSAVSETTQMLHDNISTAPTTHSAGDINDIISLPNDALADTQAVSDSNVSTISIIAIDDTDGNNNDNIVLVAVAEVDDVVDVSDSLTQQQQSSLELENSIHHFESVSDVTDNSAAINDDSVSETETLTVSNDDTMINVTATNVSAGTGGVEGLVSLVLSQVPATKEFFHNLLYSGSVGSSNSINVTANEASSVLESNSDSSVDAATVPAVISTTETSEMEEVSLTVPHSALESDESSEIEHVTMNCDRSNNESVSIEEAPLISTNAAVSADISPITSPEHHLQTDGGDVSDTTPLAVDETITTEALMSDDGDNAALPATSIVSDDDVNNSVEQPQVGVNSSNSAVAINNSTDFTLDSADIGSDSETNVDGNIAIVSDGSVVDTSTSLVSNLKVEEVSVNVTQDTQGTGVDVADSNVVSNATLGTPLENEQSTVFPLIETMITNSTAQAPVLVANVSTTSNASIGGQMSNIGTIQSSTASSPSLQNVSGSSSGLVSLNCYETLRFVDFQAKMTARLQKSNSSMFEVDSSTLAGAASGGGSNNVFRILMQRIKALEVNTAIMDMYIIQLTECYRIVTKELLMQQQQNSSSTQSVDSATSHNDQDQFNTKRVGFDVIAPRLRDIAKSWCLLLFRKLGFYVASEIMYADVWSQTVVYFHIHVVGIVLSTILMSLVAFMTTGITLIVVFARYCSRQN